MTLLRRIPLLAWILAPIVAAALIAWPLGGWDTVKVVSKEIPAFASGQVFHGHRFDVEIGEVVVSQKAPTGYDAPEGKSFVIVHTVVTNVWHEAASSGELVYNVVLENHKFEGKVHNTGISTALDDDGTSGPELNPGLERNVDLVYTVRQGAVAVGDTLHLTLYDSIPRAGFVLYGTSWVDLFVAGTADREVSG